MAENETRVVYRAIADFSALRREVQGARRDVAALRNEEALLNEQSAKAARDRKNDTKTISDEADAWEDAAAAAGQAARETMQKVAATREAVKAEKELTDELPRGTRAQREYIQSLRESRLNTDRHAQSNNALRRTFRDLWSEIRSGRSAMDSAGRGAIILNAGLDRLSNWRPRLIPPFVALVPVIAAVFGAINPLVALLGALGGAAIGLAGQLGSLAGVALSLPGIFSAIAAGIGSTILAFGGVGEVFKAASALREAEQSGKGDPDGLMAAQLQRALDRLSPSAQEFTLSLLDMRDAWSALQRNVQETFFSQFAGDIDLLNDRLPVLENLLNKAAGAMGNFFSKAIRMVTSDPWTEDFNTLAESNAVNITNMGDTLLYLADALRHITLAAAPFTEWLTGSLAEGAKNFSDMAKAGRETGDLAAWLEKVAGRLAQWWRIVKNIGATIFNYSAAAAPFGQWLTDGMERMTEGWRRASEEARGLDPFGQPDNFRQSPFQQWLEDIKPILTELNLLAGAFFGWFGREAADKSNIEDVVNLLELIRTDLGPAVARFFEVLAETNIDERLVEALSRIVEAVTTILEAGGNAAFDAFFNVVIGFFEGLADFVDNFPPGSLDWLFSLIGVIAGLALIQKFPGVALLIDGLTGLVTHRKDLLTIFNKIASLDKLKFLGVIGAGAAILAILGAEAIANESRAAAGKQVGEAMPKEWLKETGSTRDQIDQQTQRTLNTNASGGQSNFNPAGADILGEEFTGPLREYLEGEWSKFLGNWENGLLQINTGWDGLRVSVNDWAFGLIGPGGSFENGWLQITGWWHGLVGPEGSFATGWLQIQTWWNGLVGPEGSFATGWMQITTWWNGLVGPEGSFATGWAQITTWWNGLVGPEGSFATGWVQITTWWNGLVGPEGKFATGWVQITGWWNGLVGPEGKFATGWNQIKGWWDGLVGPEGKFARGWTQISGWWNSLVGPDGKFATGWNQIKGWWSERVTAVKTIFEDIKTKWNGFWEQFRTFNLAKAVGDAFSKLWGGIFGETGGSDNMGVRGPNVMGPAARRAAMLMPKGLRVTETLGNRAYDLANGVGRSPNSYHYDRNNPAMDVAGPTPLLHEFYRRLVQVGGWRQILWQVPGHYDHVHVANKGGEIQNFALGGGVRAAASMRGGMRPRGLDTVPAMLQPGEFVIRKRIVDLFGAGTFDKLNRGALSYSEMMRSAYANAGKSRDRGEPKGLPRTAYFNAGGLAGDVSYSSFRNDPPPPPSFPDFGGFGGDAGGGPSFGDINIHYPAPEPASDSLPRAIRKVVYLSTGR